MPRPLDVRSGAPDVLSAAITRDRVAAGHVGGGSMPATAPAEAPSGAEPRPATSITTPPPTIDSPGGPVGPDRAAPLNRQPPAGGSGLQPGMASTAPGSVSDADANAARAAADRSQAMAARMDLAAQNSSRTQSRTADAPRAAAAPPASPVDLAVAEVEPARVRQAAELLRRWQSGSTGTDAAASDGGRQGAPAVAAAAPSSVPSTAGPTPTTAGTDGAVLPLTTGQVAAEQLVQRVLQGQARQMNSLSFQLAPAELGQLRVQMRRQGDRLEIAFTTTHSTARELLEASLPSLRALLQDVGIQLTDAEVRQDSGARDGMRSMPNGPSHGDGSERQSQHEHSGARRGSELVESVPVEAAPSASAGRTGHGIDAFA